MIPQVNNRNFLNCSIVFEYALQARLRLSKLHPQPLSFLSSGDDPILQRFRNLELSRRRLDRRLLVVGLNVTEVTDEHRRVPFE